jgi:hypothetical protein
MVRRPLPPKVKRSAEALSAEALDSDGWFVSKATSGK